jgi:hypothetical protein
MEKRMAELQVNHLEIAARTWATEKAREIGGIVAGDVLSKSGAHIQALDLKSISEAESYARRFLAAWLKNCVIEFMNAYASDVEERSRQIERILNEHVATSVNAPLIHATPELLAALQSACNHMIMLQAYLATCSTDVIVDNLESTIAGLRKQLEEAEAAIRKAKGESQ